MGTGRADYNSSWSGFLMPFYSLTNFKIQKYYQNESKFNGVYSRNNVPKIKNRVYVINLDEFKSIGTHWIALYANSNGMIYSDSSRVEHSPKKQVNFTFP